MIIPEVSAGSNHVGASDTWTAYVIWPSGAPAAGPVSPAMATTSARVASRNERTRVMKVLLGRSRSDGLHEVPTAYRNAGMTSSANIRIDFSTWPCVSAPNEKLQLK